MNIQTNFCTEINFRAPQVFRYMPKNFVDDFLNQGKLRLSSFKKYREEDHPEKGDEKEGKFQLMGFFNPGFLHANGGAEDYQYVLCTSMLGNKNIMAQFEANDCFVISNPLQFAAEIASNIPGCKRVFQGVCNYNENFSVYSPNISLEGTNGLAEHQADALLRHTLGSEHFFKKPSKYSSQYEYRFVFETDREVSEYIDIVSIAASKLCMRPMPDFFC